MKHSLQEIVAALKVIQDISLRQRLAAQEKLKKTVEVKLTASDIQNIEKLLGEAYTTNDKVVGYWGRGAGKKQQTTVGHWHTAFTLQSTMKRKQKILVKARAKLRNMPRITNPSKYK